MTTEALWYVAPGTVALRPGDGGSATDGVTVQALYSGLSRGTERLVLEGRVPASEHERMRCPHQEGAFPFPVKYGYAVVGRLVDGAEAGRVVFALHPHQRMFRLPRSALHALPADVPPRRGVLAANMETALTALWDSGASAGDAVVVIGAGVVGLLIAALAARLPGARVTVVDIEPGRAAIAQALGLAFAAPADAPQDQDVAINASGTAAGLVTAMACAGGEAAVVEASWHGSAPVTLPLGEAFHARRLRLISSQVGAIPAARLPRWTHARRLATALSLLSDPTFDRLITREVAFADAAQAVPDALRSSTGLMTVLRYD